METALTSSADSENGATIKLPARLDMSNVSDLREEILGHVGKDISIDGSDVEHLGMLGAQLLKATAVTWGEAGHTIKSVNWSTGLREQLGLYGLSASEISTGEAA